MTLLPGGIPGFIRIPEQEYEKPVLFPLGASQKKGLTWRYTGQRTGSDRPGGERGIKYGTLSIKALVSGQVLTRMGMALVTHTHTCIPDTLQTARSPTSIAKHRIKKIYLVGRIKKSRDSWWEGGKVHRGNNRFMQGVKEEFALILSPALSYINTLRTGILNCLNARSRGLTFRHRASCI